MVKKKAFFLDRDGVLNVEIGYLHEAEKTILLPGVAEALQLIHQAGFMVIVVTNQSGVAKKMYPVENIHQVHARLQRLLLGFSPESAADAWYYCPHDPAVTGKCSCRKPEPGMLLQAAADFDVDLSESYMIGDRIHDLFAGVNAGCAGVCLVTTGYNEESNAEHRKLALAEGFPVAASLPEAVNYLLSKR
ncbi:MAG: HAD family hydrolase [Lentisphaeria bacterium]|nr:HAD family hydrolase [Lentisphaeria bacterium]